MADSIDSVTQSLQFAGELRGRTRLARNIHWFALVVFGAVVLGAMPFYLSFVGSADTPGCKAAGSNGFVCATRAGSGVPLGGGLGTRFAWTSLNRWETVYWAVSIVLGYAAVVVYYRRRSRSVGVQGRMWPFVVTGVGLLLLGIFSGGSVAAPRIPDFWMRGTQALVIIAIGIAVLALVERDRPLGIFAAGFFGLALLSCLYNDVNVLARIGLAAPFYGSGNQLPNLLVPGLYLLLGGIGFWISRRLAGNAA
jgi:hypothetical protein